MVRVKIIINNKLKSSIKKKNPLNIYIYIKYNLHLIKAKYIK